MNFIGLDAGSVSVKLVILDENGNLLYKIYRRHKGHPLSVTLDILKEIAESFLLVHGGSATPKRDFAELVGDERVRAYLGREMTSVAEALA